MKSIPFTYLAFSGKRPGRVRRFFERRVKTPLLRQLQSGASIKKLSASMSMGYVSAAYPQIGCTSIMGFLLGFVLRLNHPTIQVTRFALSPIQFILMIPHLRLGELICGVEPFRMPLTEIVQIVYTDPIGSFAVLWWPLVYAVVGWLAASALLFPFIYMISFNILKRLKRQTEQLAGELIDGGPDSSGADYESAE